MFEWMTVFNGSVGMCRVIVERRGQKNLRVTSIHNATQFTVHMDAETPDELVGQLVGKKVFTPSEARRVVRQIVFN